MFSKLDLFKNFYYMLGLGIQKGLLYLIIPLILWKFGSNTYADYVVIYSVVQITGLFMALSTPTAFMVYWHDTEDKPRYISTLLYLTIAISIICAIPIGLFLQLILAKKAFQVSLFRLILLILAFAFFFNLNTLGLNLLRSLFAAKKYFAAVFSTAILFCLALYCLPNSKNNLSLLIVLNISALILQTTLFFIFSKIKFHWKIDLNYAKSLIKSIGSYCLPFTLYSALSLTIFTIDKYLIKLYFSNSALTEYVLNFQLAFVTNIISLIIGMHSLPTFCHLVAEHQHSILKKKLLENYVLALIGSSSLAVLAYLYAWLTRIPLTYGFWLFIIAFIFTNLFTVNVGVLEAYKKAKSLLVITLAPSIAFWLVFIFTLPQQSLMFIYYDYIIYYLVLFIISTIVIRKISP